jgi:hypothetical protein
LMDKFKVPIVYRPRTLPFHGGNRGSNPLGDANFGVGWVLTQQFDVVWVLTSTI